MNIFSLTLGEDKEELADKCKGFEVRPQQTRMAVAVQNALASRRHLIVEAGTGVGKSLAYLLPLIDWAVKNNKKAVVSTYTKTLQEQLVKKDLPELKKITGLDFKFALCVGSRNYLCLRRLGREDGFDLFDPGEDIAKIREWSKTTGTGLRFDLDLAIKEEAWGKVCRESDLCLGKKCPEREDCFYYKARKREFAAQVLVVNHHLFFSDIAGGGNVLPAYEAVVFDEAHTLEDVATSYLGIEISNLQLKYFFDSLFNPETGKGFLGKFKNIPRDKINTARRALGLARDAGQLFSSEVMLRFGSESNTVRIRQKEFETDYLKEPLAALACALEDIFDNAQSLDDKVEIRRFITHAREFSAILDKIINMELDGYVYWAEILNRRQSVKWTLCAAPVEIAQEFKKQVLDNIRPVIFTSATLSVNGNFDFIRKNLGIGGDCDELLLDSPFDYANNAFLYLPHGLPNPSLEFDAYQEKAIEEIIEILKITRGRTFVLLTSYKMMDKVFYRLKENFCDLEIMRQGDWPRYKLLEKFKRNHHSVILGTDTFWQGIDVPGKALECVIITKLPFAVPDEPIVEAKMEALAAQNKNPFTCYQLPHAVTMFRQGFGRLIRTKTDKGVVAVLDPRVNTRAYGKYFLNALPPCRRVYDIADVAEFLSGE